ncbi:MAG TPA: MFS transporter [Vicinamibacterales bacterium]|jgi:MHS family proline/betaine transporter-like MFS transporter|nr:MFS transporter [Vicinamibacterales bacterium]
MTATADVETRGDSRRAVAAAVVGNVLEWYDFAVYGYFAAMLGKNFFPSGDDVTSLLHSFAAFGVGFVVRPLGGLIVGRMGDVQGRKAALVFTLLLMAAGTAGIGVIPDARRIGLWAPALLVALRLMQGFSAGGEWAGSTAYIVEWAPRHRRGFYGSFQQSAVAGGLLLGSGAAALLASLITRAQMEQWGWRIPFLLGGVLAPIGLYMRRNIGETPALLAARKTAPPSIASPHVLLAAKAFGVTVLWTVSYYMMLTYMPTFTERFAGLDSVQALWSNTLGLVVIVLMVPLTGRVSDRVGRKPLLLASCLAFAFLSYFLFRLLAARPGLATVAGVQVAFGLMIALFSGPGPAAIAEIFPTRSRSTWMSAGYTLSTAIFGGFAPFIATWLIAATGSPTAPAYYVMAAAAVSTIVIASLRETGHDELR